MAVVIVDTPDDYGLVNNDNTFVFYSTNYTATQRFQILILPYTYPTDPIIATFRVYPRPSTDGNVNRAFFDPSRTLQSLISSDIAIPSANHQGFIQCLNSHTEYNILVREEDKDAAGVYQLGDLTISSVKSVWNGVKKFVDWLDFDYQDYITGSSASKFLTESPRTIYLNDDQSQFLHFIATAANNGYEYTINVFNSAGTQTFTSRVANPNQSSIPTGFGYKYLRIPVGSYDIANVDPALATTAGINTCLVGASYYTIKLTRSGVAKSETFTFYLNQKCTKYTPIRLQWLNRLGGYDAFNFTLKSEETTDVKRANFVQQPRVFSGTGWDYTKMSRGRTEYDTQEMVTLKVNTDYLTDAESAWMADLFGSPVIYQEINNELIAVNIDGKSISKQTSLNDKLMQYTFDIDYSMTNTRQRG